MTRPCPNCSGRGTQTHRGWWYDEPPTTHLCQSCEGSGVAPACPACNDTGKVGDDDCWCREPSPLAGGALLLLACWLGWALMALSAMSVTA